MDKITASIRSPSGLGANVNTIPSVNGDLGGAKLLQGPKGDDGKSAYDLAVEGGYTGTQEEFEAFLATLPEQAQLAQESAEAAELSAQESANSAEAAAESAELAQSAVGKTSYIGENGNWFEWDANLGMFVDTGYSSTALRDLNSGNYVRMWFGTVAEYNALSQIESDVYYNILEGAV